MTNLKKFNRPYSNPIKGDFFILNIQNDLFHWGRVVSTEASVGGFDQCVLIYIYDVVSKDSLTPPKLDVGSLLLPPIATNDLVWKRGYFKTVLNLELKPDDLLQVHCFEDTFLGRYYDDAGSILDRRYEPCGSYALSSYASIDDKLSEVLGIALAPE